MAKKDYMDIQPVLIETLKFTIDFFEKHGLRYYACGGTMLGAVRHHAIIPWDDDIDIYMPRGDYERLLALKAEFQGTGYGLVSAQTDPGYYCPFAKVQKDDYTIWEFKYYPYVLGAYVDVFPLDYFDCNDAEINRMQDEYSALFVDYQKSLKTYDFADYMQMIRRGDFVGFAKNLAFQMLYKPRRQHYYDRWRNADSYLNADEGCAKCVCLTQWQGKIFRREWFDDCIDMPFGDFTIKVPRAYDQYLTLLYGDYMQLPPEDKRVSDHRHYYQRAGKRMTIEEIRKTRK